MARLRYSAPANINRFRTLGAIFMLTLLSGCLSPQQITQRPIALLLVSLEDGSIIRQDVNLDADVCMKTIDNVATTCFTQGEPIFSEDHLQIIGYEMERSEISLYPQ